MTLVLPTLQKTWQFNINQIFQTSGYLTNTIVNGSTVVGDFSNVLYYMVYSMLNFANSPWTVVNSCNASAISSSFNWTPSNMTWVTAGAHSWIVLKQTGIAGNAQICIDCPYNNNGCIDIVVLPSAGFGSLASGTLTARPTSTLETTILSNTPILYQTYLGGFVLNVMQTTDGACTRIFIFQGGDIYTNIFLEIINVDSSSTLSHKGVYFASTNTTTINPANSSFNGFSGSIKYTTLPMTEFYGAIPHILANNGAISDFTGGYPMCPLSIHSATSGALGRAGRLSDIYLGSTSIASGSTYGSQTWAQFGGYIIPWNSTTPLIT
jgi:hypothetical protein